MAFKNKEFSVIAYANGWTMWHYKSRDDFLDEIVADIHYFEKVRCLMNTGDIVILDAKDSVGLRYVDLMDDDAVVLRKLQ